MSWFVVSLILIGGNALLSYLDVIFLGGLSSLFYTFLNLPAVPALVIRFITGGILNLVFGLVLLLVLRVEIYIAVQDEKHWLHRPLQVIHKFLGNKGEGWPFYLLGLASIIHLGDLYLVFDQTITPRLWWGAAALFFGLWGNYLFGDTGRFRKKRKKRGAREGAEPDQEIRDGSLLDILTRQKWYHNQIIFHHPWPGKQPLNAQASWKKLEQRYKSSPSVYVDRETQEELLSNPTTSDLIQGFLSSRREANGSSLYSHQAEVLETLSKNETPTGAPAHALMATSHGSGRTTVGLIAALKEVMENDQTVLVIYPDPVYGRILINNFLDLLNDSGWNWSVTLATYWSDTDELVWIGKEDEEETESPPDILFTDIAGVNESLLPEHKEKHIFFEQLGLILVENAEEFHGVFGADASFVLNRLLRIAKLYGSQPQILAMTMRLAGLENLFEGLFSLKPEEFSYNQIIEEDTREKKAKEIIFWNPQLDHKRAEVSSETKLHRSNYLDQTNQVLTALIKEGYKFVLLQKTIPVCGADVAATNQAFINELQFDVKKEIEIIIGESIEIAYSGEAEIQQLSAEDFEVAVLLGVPASWINIMHDLEHLGNGSNLERPKILVILPDTPLAQYIGRRAAEHITSFSNLMETVIPLSNPVLLEGHILAALREHPADEREIAYWFGENGRETFKQLLDAKKIQKISVFELSEEGQLEEKEKFIPSDSLFFERGNYYSVLGRGSWELFVGGKPVGFLPGDIIGRLAYPGAILVHYGQRFEINEEGGIDFNNRRITATRIGEPLSTERLFNVQIEYDQESNLSTEKEYYAQKVAQLRPSGREIGIHSVIWGTVKEEIFSYVTYNSFTYDSPVRTKPGKSFLREPFITRIYQFSILGAPQEVHCTLANLIRVVLPLFIREVDEKYEVMVIEEGLLVDGDSALVVYDSMEGGTGVADWFARGNNLQRVIEKAYDVLVSCPCSEGCRGCIEIPVRINDPSSMDKVETIRVLSEVLAENGDEVISQRTDVISSTEAISPLVNEIVHYIFPHKLGMHIKDVAEHIVVTQEDLSANVSGTYFSGPNEVHVKPHNLMDMIAILAHEYAHNWQYRGMDPMCRDLMDNKHVPYFDGKLLVEGFAQWVEYKVADYYGFREVMDQVKFRHFDEYKEGFEALKWIDDNGGASKVMEYIRTGRLVIKDREMDLERLLKESDVKSRMRDQLKAYKENPPEDDIAVDIPVDPVPVPIEAEEEEEEPAGGDNPPEPVDEEGGADETDSTDGEQDSDQGGME